MEAKINLRIEETIKAGLEEVASENNQSLSQYLRELLTDHILDYEENNEDFQEFPEPVTLTHEENDEYEKSFQFTYLLTWMFCRQMHPVDTNNKEVIVAIKNRVELTINKSSFSQELKLEFVKVLSDINRFLVEPDYDNKHFVFPIPNNHLSFDYYKLMNEIWSLKS